MGQSELSSSEEFVEEPAEETQIQDEPPEQPSGQDSGEEKFYDLDISDINRDTLTPEMQSAYDNMLEQKANMQANYTQKTQGISALTKDAEAWRAVTSHPQLSKYVYDGIYKMENNLPLDNQMAGQTQETPQPPDPQDNPDAYIRNIIRQEVSELLTPVQNQMSQVTGFVRSNQATLEFDNLQAKYPAAKGLGIQAIQRVQSQYTGPNGRNISMEEALTLMTKDDSSLLMKPQGNPPPRPKRAAVEKPLQSRGKTEETPLPKGVRGLMEQTRTLEKAGKISLKDRAESALDKMRKSFNPE